MNRPGGARVHGTGQDNDPRGIALIDEHEFTRGCIATCLEVLCRDMEVSAFASWTEAAAAGPETFRLVVHHAHAKDSEPGSTAIPCVIEKMKPTPVLVVSDVDDLDTMVSALAAGVCGFVPASNTSLRVAIEIMHLVSAGGMFAPVSLPRLERARAQSPDRPPPQPTSQFTPRQFAVLERLKRGSANKVIAHELSMSEGTVKVHVRNIMRKLNATNRTQAVFRAFNVTEPAAPMGHVPTGAPCNG